MTSEDFKRVALDYLSKRIATASHLRKVLERRIHRAAVDEDTAQSWRESIDAALADLTRAGLLDDGLYAHARGVTLARKGASRHMVVQQLAGHGVDRALAQATAREIDDERQALIYARRRRLGPFRTRDREDRRDRDVAAMARAGFPVDLAIKAVDGLLECEDEAA